MTVVYVTVLAPFVAALVGFFLGKRWPRTPVPVSIAGAAVALVGATVLGARAVTDAPLHDVAQIATVHTGAFDIDVALRLDGLAGIVSVAVAVVALAVQVYSSSYLKGDPRYSSYAAFVSLFTAAMMLVVFADDLFVLLVGWEVMGVCSYFLIGHHWELADAQRSAVKAFVVTRLGDVGFLFGIFTLSVAAGGSRITNILTFTSGGLSEHTATVATLLLLCGVVGKSAQFPLHTWLPDAMAGPTPISALIHAATMVAAGIYLVARLYPCFSPRRRRPARVLRSGRAAGADIGDPGTALAYVQAFLELTRGPGVIVREVRDAGDLGGGPDRRTRRRTAPGSRRVRRSSRPWPSRRGAGTTSS